MTTLTAHRKLQSLYSAKEIEAQKQITLAQSAFSSREAEYEKKLASMKAAIAAKDTDTERQLAEAKEAAQAEADHYKRRNEAEIADLRATISSLEASLQKVWIAALIWAQEIKHANQPRQPTIGRGKRRPKQRSCKPNGARAKNCAYSSILSERSIQQPPKHRRTKQIN